MHFHEFIFIQLLILSRRYNYSLYEIDKLTGTLFYCVPHHFSRKSHVSSLVSMVSRRRKGRNVILSLKHFEHNPGPYRDGITSITHSIGYPSLQRLPKNGSGVARLLNNYSFMPRRNGRW